MTLIDTEPTPTHQPNRHRWPIIAVAAAAVAALVVGGVVLAARSDDDPNEQIPAATTVAPDPDASAAEAEEVARRFVDAFVAGDADQALTYLADAVIATEDQWGSPEGFRRDIAWQEPTRTKLNVHDCQRHDGATEDPRSDDPALAASSQPISTMVRCGLDFHQIGSDALGHGPYEVSWDLTVRDGKIVSVNRGGWEWTQQYDDEMWRPFAAWIRTEHPDDVPVMYQDSSQDWEQRTDEALRLWEQRTEEYVQAVLMGRETYAADVGAICATQAAQLGELAAPAEGALDQVAAWHAAAATIMEQAHDELIALDRPPSTDTMAYTTFYGRLTRLARITEESAAAATAGDSTRLAELDTEYLEVRQATMSSDLAGSGLEECLASIPS